MKSEITTQVNLCVKQQADRPREQNLVGSQGQEGLRDRDQQRQSVVHGMDKQQGPPAWQRKPQSVSCDKPQGKRM